MGPTYQLVTLGCKVNQYESQQIRESLNDFGLTPVSSGKAPDLALVNTCAVTVTAMRKSRQAVRRLANGGRTPVIVVGCGASADADRLRGIPHVKAVLGHDVNVLAEVRRLVGKYCDAPSRNGRGRPIAPWPRSQPRPDDDGDEVSMSSLPGNTRLRKGDSSSALFRSPDSILPLVSENVKLGGDLAADRIEAFEGRQRAFVKVQDGCNAFCTHCIIPRLRPRLRSKPIPVAVAEVRGLVAAGYREIIVTGIFLGAYGRETAIRRRWDHGRSPLADLVRALARVEGLARLRLSSLEPADVDHALLDVYAERENCVPHLHLPLQSGSGRILARMNRQYGVNAFVNMIDRVRETLDRPAISTDIIVGFPGETEAEFTETLGIARYAGFSKIHAFPFSPREGTAANRWRRDFVPTGLVRERMARLAELERELSLAFRRQFLGQTERVIVENGSATPNGTAVATENPDPGRSADAHESQRRAATSPPKDGTRIPSSILSRGRNAVPTSREPARALRPTASMTLAGLKHGRTDRHFEVYFESASAAPGDLISIRIDRVTPTRTHGTPLD